MRPREHIAGGDQVTFGHDLLDVDAGIWEGAPEHLHHLPEPRRPGGGRRHVMVHVLLGEQPVEDIRSLLVHPLLEDLADKLLVFRRSHAAPSSLA